MDPVGSKEKGYVCGWGVERCEIIVFIDTRGEKVQICVDCFNAVRRVVEAQKNG